jgi:hypothetical protein
MTFGPRLSPLFSGKFQMDLKRTASRSLVFDSCRGVQVSVDSDVEVENSDFLASVSLARFRITQSSFAQKGT